MKTIKTCPKCRKPLPPDSPEGLCPECLLQAGLGSPSDPNATVAVPEDAVRPREMPKTDESFGGYRIVRELGRGGMGAVYEAEHLESGRRVALKVLSQQLDSPTARARFLREGRLAASINHPNSVYIYGTEEIEGTPAIAMELVLGGTLQERVQRTGPLSVGEAVDAILQVIAGLEAAQAIGILHRDIKPANCFQDADGVVKVGDFGLSISTAARGDTNLTLQGSFLGTPAFCSPEQLRGDELNVRSDMYSVGVTLFYLLTGHTPFEAKNMVQLLATVLEQAAPSPKKFRAEIPQGLANVVLRCLQKQPGDRFKSYDELRQALAPFSPDAPIPAPLLVRFAGGVVDMVLVSGASMMICFLLLGDLAAYSNPASYKSPRMLAMMAGAFGAWLLYYTLLEGLRGASLGKMLFRMRVTGPDRNAPGLLKAFLRACIYLLPPVVPYWIGFLLDPMGFAGLTSNWARYGGNLSYYLVLALLFSTARRRNGLAALHDLLTRTRVIRKPAHQARPVLAANEATPPATENRPKVGPFHVIETLEKTDAGEWLLGYDTRLLRKVWIRVVPFGTPPVAPHLRSLGRVGRLRWLSGRRSAEDNWDVFEGITGMALARLAMQPQSWTRLRFWLFDLATEISAAEKDGTLPTLALDRVWITADGRAKLLDFPVPGAAREQTPPLPSSSRMIANEFLAEVARVALAGLPPGSASPRQPAVPPPLHAQTFLKTLPALANAETIATTLRPLLQRLATVSRLRRASLVAGCMAFPLLATVAATFGMRVYSTWQRNQPEIAELAQVLNSRAGHKMVARWTKTPPKIDDQTFGIFIASHFRATITNTPQMSTLYAISSIAGDNRKFAELSLSTYPNPTAKEINEADTILKPIVRRNEARVMELFRKPSMGLVVFGASLVMYVGLPALLLALVCRGGLVLLACGVAVVRRDGRRASRLRAFWRSLIAWSPVFGVPVLLLAVLIPLMASRAATAVPAPALRVEEAVMPVQTVLETQAVATMGAPDRSTNAATTPAVPPSEHDELLSSPGAVWCCSLLGLVMLSLVGASLALPERSLQDRLAGTCLVPR